MNPIKDSFEKMDWPLMKNNITSEDLEVVISFLKGNPVLTQSNNVLAFEQEWSRWLGLKYSVFVNSGSSANLITIAALKQKMGGGEIIVPALTWASDISAVIHAGFDPIFVDINPDTLCMDDEQVIKNMSSKTRAVFITYTQGFNGLTDRLLDSMKEQKIPLIEDVCESHGATFNDQKLGTFGLMSNFSFYYAHHMSTIEGGMICTDNEDFYQLCRLYRSHGMVRESTSNEIKQQYAEENPDLNPEFIFAFPAYNLRNTEIGAVLGRNQLKKLDKNNDTRKKLFKLFLENLDSSKYKTDFSLVGSCNYAFNLVIKNTDPAFRDRVIQKLKAHGIEFRRGSAGGGNQLRQPYIKKAFGRIDYKNFPEVEHIHFFGLYIGNYPDLSEDRVKLLTQILNEIN